MYTAEAGTLSLVMKDQERQDPIKQLGVGISTATKQLVSYYRSPADTNGQSISEITDTIADAYELAETACYGNDLQHMSASEPSDVLTQLTGLDQRRVEILLDELYAYTQGDGANTSLKEMTGIVQELGGTDLTQEDIAILGQSISSAIDIAQGPLYMKSGTSKKATPSSSLNTNTSGTSGTPQIPGNNKKPNGNNRNIASVPKKVIDFMLHSRLGCVTDVVGFMLGVFIVLRVVAPIGGAIGRGAADVANYGVTRLAEGYKVNVADRKGNPTLFDINHNGLLRMPSSEASQVIQARYSTTVSALASSRATEGTYPDYIVTSIPNAILAERNMNAEQKPIKGPSPGQLALLTGIVQIGLDREDNPDNYTANRDLFLQGITNPERRRIVNEMFDFIIAHSDAYRVRQGDSAVYPPSGLYAETNDPALNAEFDLLEQSLQNAVSDADKKPEAYAQLLRHKGADGTTYEKGLYPVYELDEFYRVHGRKNIEAIT